MIELVISNLVNKYQPLTANELALAKAQRVRNAGNNFIDAMSSDCTKEQETALQALNQAGGLGKFIRTEPQQFMGMIPSHMLNRCPLPIRPAGPIPYWVTMTRADFKNTMGFGLPSPGATSIGNYVNSNILSRGSTFFLDATDGFRITVCTTTRNVIVFDRNNNFVPLDDNGVPTDMDCDYLFQYMDTLKGLIMILENDNGRDSFTISRPEILESLLQKMNLDTSQAFWINGRGFELEGHRLVRTNQTPVKCDWEPFTPPPEFHTMSHEELNQLVQRAYAQGLFNTVSSS